MTIEAEIQEVLRGAIAQEFTCPDGHTRKLLAFESVENTIVLQFKGGHFPEYSHAEFRKEWTTYQPVREGSTLVVSQTGIPPAEKLPETIEALDAVLVTKRQADQVMDTTDLVKLLSEQMKKVASGNPAAINQAHAMSSLARQVLEAGKLKLNLMKVVHQINQPAK